MESKNAPGPRRGGRRVRGGLTAVVRRDSPAPWDVARAGARVRPTGVRSPAPGPHPSSTTAAVISPVSGRAGGASADKPGLGRRVITPSPTGGPAPRPPHLPTRPLRPFTWHSPGIPPGRRAQGSRLTWTRADVCPGRTRLKGLGEPSPFRRLGDQLTTRMLWTMSIGVTATIWCSCPQSGQAIHSPTS
ncbi:hypothetical protein ACFPM0_37020 [Pseudonocardia sulfidoxydans]|uniref:hypothetical protein n=1 Tax=Pseudonocardia sulfidoxydans TaxID=54011 RepID=UPI00360D9BE6